MTKFIKKIFGIQPRRLPGTVMEPMTKEEAEVFWARFHDQAAQQSRGW